MLECLPTLCDNTWGPFLLSLCPILSLCGLATSRNWLCYVWFLWKIVVTDELDNANFGLPCHPEQFEACEFHITSLLTSSVFF